MTSAQDAAATLADSSLMLHNLKRKRTRERTNITRFINAIDSFTEDTNIEDYNHYRDRLEDTLTRLTQLDDVIHDLITDAEYEADILTCEDYIDNAKRGIQKATRGAEKKHQAGSSATFNSKSSLTPTTQITHSVKLPTVKLEPFSGDIEKWMRFWEQFSTSIDNDPSLSTVNKHIFLRGYLQAEPKQLVDGIPVTASTYEQTKKILISRYGDRNRIIQAHIDYLEDIRPIDTVCPATLNSTYIDCNTRIQSLQALGEDVNGYGRVLAPKILRAFPEDICRRWIMHARRNQLSEGDIIKLMEFLGEEVDGALIAQKIRGDSIISNTLIPATTALQIHAKPRRSTQKPRKPAEPFCAFCDQRGHWAQDCMRVTSIHDRTEKLKANNRCFLCLQRGHRSKDCAKRGRASCLRCKGNHHRSICAMSDHNATHNTSSVTTTVGKINTTSPGFTHLQTARIWVMGPTGLSKATRCVLDGGSQSSFIAKNLIDELRLEVIADQQLTVTGFEASSATTDSRKLVRLNVKGIWNKTEVPLTAFESTHSFSHHPTVPHDITMIGQTRKLHLADPTDTETELPIEVLIGGDQYWKIATDAAPIRLSSSLVLIPSKFGWIFSGNRSGISVCTAEVNFINSHSDLPISDASLRRFWDLETIGITNEPTKSLSTKDAKLLEEFHASYCLEDHRRIVCLPRDESISLTDNYTNAVRRFHSLEKRLENSKSLRDTYEAQMSDYINKGHVERAPSRTSKDTFYLPHHLVKKEKCGNTKWRIVFDGSSHEKHAPSLNDVLKMGPNLLPEILAVLIRFRLNEYAIVGDITQAFLQLTLHTKDRDLTRFLWYNTTDNKEPQTAREWVTYRFTRLPFGLTCSPFLLSATIRELAEEHKSQYPLAAPLIDGNTFMDDFAAGTSTENDLIMLYYELTSLMKRRKLPMSKWASNSQQLRKIWEVERQEIATKTHVLGVAWNTSTDTLSIDSETILENSAKGPATKRRLLQSTAMFFDPLGLITPLLITGKILFQDTWCRGLEWDELLPHDLAVRWHHWISTIPHLSHIFTARWVCTTDYSQSQIHVFCDASERAYGAALYVRSTIGNKTVVHLVCSKSRLAPVKKVTLPRLELLAALIGTRLLNYFCEATSFDIKDAILWSDSTVTLGWIRNDPSRWKTFVCNRVTEIQAYTAPSQWKHCPGSDNPADHLSRGVRGDTLKELTVWWHGPSWLSKESSQWPPDVRTPETLIETRNTVKQILHVETPDPIIDINRFSSYVKLLRVTARVLRLMHILRRRDHQTGDLTAQEMKDAQNYWLKTVQQECFPKDLRAIQQKSPLPHDSKIKRFNPFLDNGLLRLGGRLEHAHLTPEQSHPIILDGDHHFTQLLISHTHIRLHHLGVRIVLSELRSTFWILRARCNIKKVLHRCLPCKMARNSSGQVIEAPLPSQRVTPQKPFAVTGVDFAGPLYVREGRSATKCYITLFTCATTRALHLELCSDMSTDKFLHAFQRFVGRRGVPHTIYSDNAQTFHSTNRELTDLWAALTVTKTHQYLSQHGINWKFIAPRAAWWGGWWERMVGSTKRCLRKVLGRSSIDEEGLRTVLISIEAALNSRPLTQNEDDGDVLTPAHFLVGDRLTTLPTGPEPTGGTLARQFRLRQQLTDDFWKRWSKEYLLQLQSFHQVRQPKGKRTQLRVGDVALLQEDVQPRHLWRKARIQELRAGRDGLVRTVILSTSEGTQIARPIQLVIPLEVDQGGEDVGE